MTAKNPRQRIAFCLPGTAVGGMERYLLRLIPWIHAHADIWVYVTGGVPGALHDKFAASTVTLRYVRLGKARPDGAIALLRELRRRRFDTVCDLSGVFGAASLTLARLAGVPRRVVFHRRSTHAFAQTLQNRLAARLLTKLIEFNATHIIANSKTALTHFHPRLIARSDPRLSVHRNIIDPRELRPTRSREQVRAALGLPADARVVLSVGSNRRTKDFGTLIAAMNLVSEALPDVYAVIAGPETEALFDEVRRRAPLAAGRILLLGTRSDVHDLLAASDLFAFPSRTEGMPNALLEAMVVGLRVVASDIPAIREIVPQIPGAELCTPGDNAAFAGAILRGLKPDGENRVEAVQAHAQVLTDAKVCMPQLLDVLVAQPENTV